LCISQKHPVIFISSANQRIDTAIPIAGVQAKVAFMAEFGAKNG
jgi:hypothetical protein